MARAVQDEDGDVLQAALAASQLQDATSGPNEVLYRNGATDLFSAIEESKWNTALEIVEDAPQQAAIWVKSTGTENTTFGWSLWRRLPLHEACRRQPPAWLVAALLKAYPESCKASTQFGCLPLHLAVEFGAAPEVVNLLIVNYYPGILQRDNSGRTPWVAGQDPSLINIEERAYIQDSLKNAQINCELMEAAWQAKMDALMAQHAQEMLQVKAAHAEAIEGERAQQRQLEKKLARMDGHLNKYREEREALDRTLSMHHVEKGAWKDTLETREELVETLVSDLNERSQEVESLKQELAGEKEAGAKLQDRVETLETDLINITLLQRDSIQSSANQAEMDLDRMLRSQEELQGQLQGQLQGLGMLLQHRGIMLPDAEPPQEVIVRDELHVKEVSDSAAKAAVAAITHAECEAFEKEVMDEVNDEILQQESSIDLQDELEMSLTEHRKDEEEKKEYEEPKRDMRRMEV